MYEGEIGVARSIYSCSFPRLKGGHFDRRGLGVSCTDFLYKA